jgi:hypothetical protein
VKSKLARVMKIADLDKADTQAALSEVTVVPRIERMLEDMNIEPISMKGELEIGDKVRRTQVFSASEVGLKNGRSLCGKYEMGCGRYLYYSYTGAKGTKHWEPRFRRILDTGSAIHVQLQLYMQKCADREGFIFQEEVDGDPDTNSWGLSAHMDGQFDINTPLAQVRFGAEIKSIGDSGFVSTTKIHDNHATQGTIYQKLFDLPFMLFLYYNKNNGNMAEFVQRFDLRRWDAIERKLDMVQIRCLHKKCPTSATRASTRTSASRRRRAAQVTRRSYSLPHEGL